jgi:hypothetical protein
MNLSQKPHVSCRASALSWRSPLAPWGKSPLPGVFASACGIAIAATACMNTEANRALPPVIVAIAETTPPLYEGGETKLFQVQAQMRLPMKKPDDDEAKALGKSPPYPRAPFLKASDVRYEVRFTLSNLDDTAHSVELLIDPWNEFARYRPGVVVGEEGVTPNFSGFDRYFVIPPKQRIEGSLTPDDMRELSVDLATAMNILDNPPSADSGGPGAGALINRAMNQQNRSNAFDPLVTPYVPSVVPGLIGFDIGLRASETMNVAVEVYVDITDVAGGKMTTIAGGEATFSVPGRIIEPPAPPAK